MERIMLCNRCGRHYRVIPTENPFEWHVVMLTGEVLRRIVQSEPTIEDAIQYTLTGSMEPAWYMAQFIPMQVQASEKPLCMIPECAVAEDLVETDVWEMQDGY